ncbi:MAG: tetratricopeptide repeat protein [Proteobacteria bacterium]|nr:tetratricopeptide repeat protein [Pseudomonadota bacterium]MBU1741127.1 tetratricopeptide repeat protein [Pseudomonadota bacterium]
MPATTRLAMTIFMITLAGPAMAYQGLPWTGPLLAVTEEVLGPGRQAKPKAVPRTRPLAKPSPPGPATKPFAAKPATPTRPTPAAPTKAAPTPGPRHDRSLARRYNHQGVKAREVADKIVWYTKAVSADPTWYLPWANRGLIYYHHRNHRLAHDDLSRSLSLNPKQVALYYFRGKCAFWLGRYTAAIADFTTAIIARPRWHQAYYLRGKSWAALGRFDRAVGDLGRVIGLRPRLTAPYLRRAYAYRRLKKFGAAASDYTRAMVLESDNARLYNLRAIAYYELKDYPRAMADVNRALDISPRFAAALRTRAFIQLALGHKDAARQDMDTYRRLATNPGPGTGATNRPGEVEAEIRRQTGGNLYAE